MKKVIVFSLLLGSLCWSEPVFFASKFDWPTSYTRIRIISVPLDCSWRDGRPFAPREKVARAFRLPAEGPMDVDLIEILSEQNWSVKKDYDGSLVIFPPAERPLPPEQTASTSDTETAAISESQTATIRESQESLRAKANFRKLCIQEHKQWIKNHPQQGLVNAIGANLARQARRPIPWTFAIILDSEPAAACTGEGMVYITTGFLSMLDRSELAGVLAHEIAHGARQHIEEDRFEQDKIEQTKHDIEARGRRAQQELSQAKSRGDMESVVARHKLAMRSFKERIVAHEKYKAFKYPTDERLADLAGMRMALAAGYQVDGLKRALTKLAARNYIRYGQRALLGSRTHPPIGDRIRALEEIMLHWQQQK